MQFYISAERFRGLLRMAGTGNAAGLFGIASALHAFKDKTELIPITKAAALFFATGVLLFAFSFTVHSVFQMTPYGEDWPYPSTKQTDSPTWIDGLIALTAIMSVFAFFVGLIVSYAVLLTL